MSKTLPIDDINYAGGILTLNCSATVSAYIDTPFKISFKWSRADIPLDGSSRVIIDNFIDNEKRTFSSIIHFPTLSASMDTGEYKCDITLDHMTRPPGHMTNSSVSATGTIFIIVSSELKTKTTCTIRCILKWVRIW